MTPRLRLVALVLLATAAALPASARLGDTLSDLKKRYGSPAPQERSVKDSAFWLFEGDDGQLMYTVTFNARGQSIAEGLKPLRRARFGRSVAMNFIDGELAPIADSKTTRVLKPGEQYHFAGRTFACGAKEYVVVDEPQGVLIIWTQEGVPSVLVLAPEMMAKL
jgi:hypothetical protein